MLSEIYRQKLRHYLLKKNTYIPITLDSRSGNRDVSDPCDNILLNDLVIRNTADVTAGGKPVVV
jgi:hypothetical protein